MKKITLLISVILLSLSGYSQIQTPFEGFESTTFPPTTPASWAVFDNGLNAGGTARRDWVRTISSVLINQGVASAYIDGRQPLPDGSVARDFLASPAVTMSATSQLKFFTRTNTITNSGSNLQIRVKLVSDGAQNDPTGYSTVQQWAGNTIVAVSNVYEEKTVDLNLFPQFQGVPIYIAFCLEHTQTGVAASTANRWLVDQVRIVTQCVAPATSSLTATNILSTSATLGWAAIAGSIGYEIERVLQTAAFTGIATDTSISNSLSLTGLTASTCYRFRVRNSCGSGNFSPWSSDFLYCTTATPPVCGGVFTDTGGTAGNYQNDEDYPITIVPNIPTNQVTVTFTAFNTQATSDTLKIYDGADTTGTLLGTYSGTTLPPPFTGSTASGALTFVFVSSGAVTASGWTANVTCNPPPACRKPTNLIISNITVNSVDLAWTNLGIVTSNEVIALPCAAPAPTAASVGVAVGNSPITFSTGINSSTCYRFYVRSLCPDGLKSEWSAMVTGTTLVAPPVCGGSFVDNGGPTGNYTNSFNNTLTPYVICPINPLDKVTVTFTAFDTEPRFDGIYVFNGNSITAPPILSTNPVGLGPLTTPGAFWGTTIPGPFESTSPDGCLTFVFKSDTSAANSGWFANVTCAPEPTCKKPAGVTATLPTANSMRLAWTNVGTNVASNEAIAVPCGTAITAATTGWVTTTSNPFILGGLNSGTCYDFYVRSNCSATDTSPNSIKASNYTLVLPPVCNGNFVDEGGFGAGDAFDYPDSSNFTRTICPNGPNQRVTITFTSFDTEANFDALYVYNGTGAVPTNLIPSNNPAGTVPGGLAGGYWGNQLIGPFTSEALDGCLTFVFRSDAIINNPGWLANVTCSQQPFCKRPRNLAATTQIATSATLSWTQLANVDGSFASSWKVIALPCSEPAPNTNTVGWTSTSSNPYTFTGLTAGTCYKYYVQAVCSGTEVSDISTALQQFTPISCGQNFYDNGGLAADYTNNADVITTICPTTPGQVVTVTFTSFDVDEQQDGLYIYDGATIAGTQITSENGAGNVPGGLIGAFWGTTNPGPFEASNPTGCLTFRFRSSGFGTGVGWESAVTCAPAQTCARPFAVSAVPTTGSALISWTQPPNFNTTDVANQWEIIVQNATLPPPTAAQSGLLISTNPYTAINLNPDSDYTVYIRAVCSNTDTSKWSSPYTFSTYQINNECDGALPAFVNQDLSCDITTPVKIKGLSLSTNDNSCLTTATRDVWYKFVANAPVQVISIGNADLTKTDKLNFAVYSGTCTNLTQVLCESAQTNSTLAGRASGLTEGNTYYVRVYGLANTNPNGLYNLCIGKIPCEEAKIYCGSQGAFVYPNKFGGKNRQLGDITCCDTTPNPAFFRLVVQNSGPLNYEITQGSQPSGDFETGFDVDYVAWGPFTNDAVACLALTSLTTPVNGEEDTKSPDCSILQLCNYSGAAIENICIPNAQACDIYIVMVTNYYDRPGYIKFTQTNVSGPAETVCDNPVDFKYQKYEFCKNEAVNPTVTLLPGSQLGRYSIIPPVASFDVDSGEIYLDSTPAGTYIITSSLEVPIPNGLCSIPVIREYSKTVTITDPAAATISYVRNSFCNNDPINEPVLLVGSTGGIYKSTPSGLNLDPVSGLITPISSLPGTYQVVVDFEARGGCPAFTSSAVSVTILPIPVINAPNTQTACLSYTLPVLTGDGKYYPSPNGVGAEITAGTIITVTQTFYVYANNGTCSNQKQFTITINQNVTPVTNFSYITPICKNNINPSPNNSASGFTAGGFYSCSDSNLIFVSTATGVVNLNLTPSGSYTIKYEITAAPSTCLLAGESTFDIVILPTAIPNTDFTYNTVCRNGVNQSPVPANSTNFTAGGTYFCSNPLLQINPVTGLVNASSPAGTYTVVYKVDKNVSTLFCYEERSSPSTIVIKPIITSNTSLTYPLAVACTLGGNLLPNVSTTYSADGIVLNAPPASLTPVITYSVSPATTPGLDLNPITGEIKLATSAPGDYVVSFSIAGSVNNCYAGSATPFNLKVNSPTAQNTIFTYSTPICKLITANQNPIKSGQFVEGGIFKSDPNNLIIDPLTGVISMTSAPGSYDVTYSLSENAVTCVSSASTTFRFVIAPIVLPTFATVPPICQGTSTAALPTSSTNIPPINGTWNLPINTSLLGQTIYTFTPNPGECASPTTKTVTITAPNIDPVFAQIAPICQGDSASSVPVLLNSSNNTPAVTGTWSPDKIKSDVVGNATYTFTPDPAQCAKSTEMIINTKPLPVFGITQECKGPAYTLDIVPDLAGAVYTWTNSADLIVNGSSAVAKAIGNYSCKVNVNGCEKTIIFNVTTVGCQVQKGISPNGDGFNDEFDLTALDLKVLDIYNRYGYKAYTKSNYKNEWVGQSNAGDVLPDGTYFYVAELNDGTTQTGWVFINKEK